MKNLPIDLHAVMRLMLRTNSKIQMLCFIKSTTASKAAVTSFLAIQLLMQLMPRTSQAQQRPRYTQFSQNYVLINPALAGIEDNVNLKAGYRQQWVGWDDAPTTSYFSVHAAIGALIRAKRDIHDTDSLRAQHSEYFSQSFEKHHQGLGLHVITDKGGLLERTDVNAAYAYHLVVKDNLNLSFGVAAGVAEVNLDKSRMRPELSLDPILLTSGRKEFVPVLSAGIWFYSKKLFAGLSAEQLFSISKNAYAEKDIKIVPQYYVTTGYRVKLAEEIEALPSILITSVQSKTYYDINSKLSFKNMFWIGGTYRKEKSFSALAGFSFLNGISLAYSYDFTSGDLQNMNNGSHEIILGLKVSR